MTHAEKRMIVNNERAIRLLEQRVATQGRLIMMLLQRKAGRPSAAEKHEIDRLMEQIDAA